MVGREMTAASAYAEAARDRPFYSRTGGGVTVSGGEPLHQRAFTAQLLRRCREGGLHTALDTAAFGPWEPLRELLDWTDLVLLDLKLMDPARHRQYTGVDNASILENARRLAGLVRERERAGASPYPPAHTGVWVRIPTIPSINDDEANLRGTARFVRQEMGPAVKRVELLGYHQLGGAKFRRLGRQVPLPEVAPPPRERLEALRQLVAAELEGTGTEVRAR